MTRRLAWLLLVVCGLFALSAGSASAAVPPGPRLTFVKTRHEAELVSSDPAGRDQRAILVGSSQFTPSAFDALAWSADGTRLVFGGLTHLARKPVDDLYLARSDGSGLTKLPQTSEALYPVLSADGRTVAFARRKQREAYRRHRGKVTVFSGVAVFVLDLGSGALRQVSPWRNRLFVYPTDFSPDGRSLLMTWSHSSPRHPSSDAVVAMDLDGGGRSVLVPNAGDATYSPDGNRLALVVPGKQHTLHSPSGDTTYRETELAVAAADGSGLTELTHTRALEAAPRWDPSGQRLAYMQFPVPNSESAFLGIGDSIMEMNADGSCETRVLSEPGATLFGVTWQPGPGREAGPIAC